MNTASRLVGATIAITAPYYFYNASRSISSVPTSDMRTGAAPSSFLKSKTHLAVVNPRDHRGLTDSRSITFKLPPSRRSWSDEQILATFVQGYFGGWVFTPERRLLGLVDCLLRRQLVGFSAIQDDPQHGQIWSCNDLSQSKLPSLHSTLFGAFRVVDYHIPTTTNTAQDPGLSDETGYVDFAFGSDTSYFSGFHRFSIHRDRLSDSTAHSSSETVTITNSCVACNPSSNTLVGLDRFRAFHEFYAMLLFREGVARVMSV
ncbi:hypothetical protein H2204_010798 [Knufia peltigerae]|uniref:Uncharacterized protein n=1 Tax=Knufia peltigerae TaxID=1002370 RepID=A0AA39CTU6_9EURO|nr:hypothetical protein H2204_010798 [Knufia peltigerae]